MHIVKQLLSFGIKAFSLTAAAVALFAALWPDYNTDEMTKTDVIVVLGAGMDPDGTLHQSTILRVDRAVELWEAGIAPAIHFTGGKAIENGPSAGQQMAQYAISKGVPATATTFEAKSLSTLQNALFSQPMLADAQTITLVTEGFHLPRAYVSFKWAGNHKIYLTYSERFRNNGESSQFSTITMILREAAVWWFNIARVIAYEAAPALGIDDKQRIDWLE